jgi:hypothetical protein
MVVSTPMVNLPPDGPSWLSISPFTPHASLQMIAHIKIIISRPVPKDKKVLPGEYTAEVWGQALRPFSQRQGPQLGARNRMKPHMTAVHEGLVHAVVRKQVLGHLSFAEALQSGRIGLWPGPVRGNPYRGMDIPRLQIVARLWYNGVRAVAAAGQ